MAVVVSPVSTRRMGKRSPSVHGVARANGDVGSGAASARKSVGVRSAAMRSALATDCGGVAEPSPTT